MQLAAWQRSEQLFHAALQRTADERSAFVEQSCADDPAVCSDVLGLLESYEAANRARDAAAADIQADEPEIPVPSRRIGAYRLEREIGHGGMGTVFLASRADDQYKKEVAIKLVRTDLSASFFAERLRGERQILAELEHPNIARLLDGGVTPAGHPYLVMEYVDGTPIDAYCESHALPIRERLQLFRQICGAVHYAHQRLVIHRDLKPANILVTADGAPKLLDFGIAKLIEPGSNRGDTTEMPMATPQYASPELMSGERVTTASDVYSLGVILCCILTGHSPYADAAGVELLNAIVNGDITRPSAISSRLNLPNASPGALRRQLRGDLDSIVLRALRKEPEARYASAELLSEDIRRHLDSLPVLAGSDSFVYGAAKFIRRNRVAVAAGAAVSVSLVAATAVSLYHSSVAAVERRLAQDRLVSLRKLTGSVLFEIHDSIQGLPGATQARKLLVQRALEYLNSLDAAAARDPSQLTQLAEAYRKIGDVQGNPTNANLGDTAGALASYAMAREFAERLLTIDRSNPESRSALALLLQRMADTVAQTGDVPKAVDTMRESLDIFASLAQQDNRAEARQKAGVAHIKLADLLGHPMFPNAGDSAGALDHYSQALAIYEGLADDATKRRYLGIIHERIGKMLEVSGRNAEAFASYEKSFLIRKALAADYPANANARRDLAIAHEKIGDLLTATGQPAQALPRYQEALTIFEALVVLDPSNANAARAVAIEYEKLGETFLRTGKSARAKQFYGRALALYQKRVESDPLNAQAKSDLDRVTSGLSRIGRLNQSSP